MKRKIMGEGNDKNCFVCGGSLEGAMRYFSRHGICSPCCNKEEFFVEEKEEAQRFCQKCAILHDITAFDGKRKSCRVELMKHNEKRRKVRNQKNKLKLVHYQPLLPLPQINKPEENPIVQTPPPSQHHNVDNLRCSNIPYRYLCPVTGEIMQDPVIVVQTGEICERTSVHILNKDTYQTIVPLVGLKSAIQQFVNSQIQHAVNQHSNFPDPNQLTHHDPKNTVQTSIEQNNGDVKNISNQLDNDNVIVNSSFCQQDDELYFTTKKYQKKVQEIEECNLSMRNLSAELQRTEKNLQSAVEEYCMEIQKFSLLEKEMKGLNGQKSSENITEIRNKLIQRSNIFLQAAGLCSQLLQTLHQIKQEFEQKLSWLEKNEVEVINLRDELVKIFTKLGIAVQFNNKFEKYSSKYKIVQNIDQGTTVLKK